MKNGVMQAGHPVSAFLSHSSADRSVVIAVHEALVPGSTWLDRAEIEWGDRFIERIEASIQSASDFVLFWSTAAAQSEWVRHETHMAFIRMLKERAIRIRVVRLDDAELPLRFEPFHFLSVAQSDNPIGDIVAALREALSRPSSGERHRFLNRNEDLGRIEALINDTDTRAILLHGFKGVGKASTVAEALRRFYERANTVTLTVGPSVGPAEAALSLYHEAYGKLLPPTETLDEALAAIEKSVTTIIERGQFLIIRDCQHWFGDSQELNEPFPTLISHASSLPQTSRKPIFLTSTRRPPQSTEFAVPLSSVRLSGLAPQHMASLVALWYEIIEGDQITSDEAAKVAGELHGLPIAAKLAASLVSQYGIEHLLSSSRELRMLRLDLAKTLIRDLSLSALGLRLMETLAIVGTPLPSTVLIEAMDMDEPSFHSAVDEVTRDGLAEPKSRSSALVVHPLLSDYFWRSHLDHENYVQRAQQIVAVVESHLRSLRTDSAAFVALLPAVCRLYALAGDFDKAQQIRRGLAGELSQAAITHYNRRRYSLAEEFITLVLDIDPGNWRVRTYLARIHVRENRWEQADELLGQLLQERPRDRGIKHLRGWRLLRAGAYDDALSAFSDVLAVHDQHVASYRDSAECLYRLGRPAEALDFLRRAKHIESDNPFALDLEARIYEEMGRFEEALAAARVAVVRSPSRWGLRHRLSRILAALERRSEALDEAREAVRLDPAQFSARSHLVSLLIDDESMEEAESLFEALERSTVGWGQRDVYKHLNARLALGRNDLDAALELVQSQIGRGRSLAKNYGLLARIRLRQASQARPGSASARLYLDQAVAAVEGCERQSDHDPRVVESLRRRLRSLGVQDRPM